MFLYYDRFSKKDNGVFMVIQLVYDLTILTLEEARMWVGQCK
jgi:hypothetical protein